MRNYLTMLWYELSVSRRVFTILKRLGYTIPEMISTADEITTGWLSEVLGEPVTGVSAQASDSTWAHQIRLKATLATGEVKALRMKVCKGDTFGCSEVDYYTQDYIGMENPPLVRHYDAQFTEGAGYHVLLDDLGDSYQNRFETPPTLEYGLALAEALGRLHAFHWESQPVPTEAFWERYFGHIRPGVKPLEEAVGVPLTDRFEALENAIRTRWADPRGMTLLHGDLNPGNILTPKSADSPVYLLDRQPFEWSVVYGLAVYDLAYACALWHPYETFAEHREAILERWHSALNQPDYELAQAREDFALSIEHCLHIPIEWCTDPEDVKNMRWVWEPQFNRLRQALKSY